MTTYPMYYTDNSNSWRRILMLVRLYWPVLRLGVIICAIVPAVLYVLASWAASVTAVKFILWPCSVLMYAAPFLLTRRDYRGVSSQLPVTATEKFGFLLLAFWIVFPAIIWVSGQIGNLIGVWTLGCSVDALQQEYVIEATGEMPNEVVRFVIFNSWWMNALTYAGTIAIMLFYLVRARENRVLSGIVSYFVTTMGCSLITGITGGVYVVCQNMKDVDMVVIIEHTTMLAAIMVTCLMTVFGTIYLVKLYKWLRNGGF